MYCQDAGASHPPFVAVNGSTVKIFGSTTVDIVYDAVTYTHRFFVADVLHNLLGFDFLAHYNLVLLPRAKKLISVHTLSKNLSPDILSSRSGRKLADTLGLDQEHVDSPYWQSTDCV